MHRVISICLLLFTIQCIHAQKFIFDRISDTAVKAMTIRTDFRNLIREKTKEIYQEGQLIVDLGSDRDTYDIELRTRGNSRQSICFYPPIKLKFSKKTYHIPEPNTVKLVNCCRDNDSYEMLLWKEYLIYRMYRKLTDISLRAQMVPITYEDVNKPKATYTRMGFLIEPEEELAKNIDGELYEPKVTLNKIMDSTLLATITVFQYVIGNTDWAIGNQHNVCIIRTMDHLPYPVPYDFDYAGLVNAGYAVPHSSLPIKTVTERYNRSYCLTEAQSLQARDAVMAKEAEMYAEIEHCAGLSEKDKNQMYSYLKEGFDLIREDRRTIQIFTKDCRQWPSN
ncbi:MAG: hypothetical protein KDC57_19380 [Saprospiraceae bacterium]|nr:hypothetical protein [Saprospiraceae bacterium]